jgi:ribosomal protein S18 acetylase RimI-like enzyme
VEIRIDGPGAPTGGLDELAPLWGQLQRVHLTTAVHRPLVAVSWERRRRWYGRVLAEGGACFTARPAAGGPPVGYAMVALDRHLDDTFESVGGIAEVATLVVADGHRGAGLGRRLLAAAQDHVRAQGIDLVRILVMSGNTAAERFYTAAGYTPGEEALYRRLT